MELCNRQIQWQNPITGEIVSRWATLSKPYYANNKEIVMTSLSQREYKVQMPFDDETALIDLDKRFMLEIINGEPKTYVTTSVDQSTERYELHGKTQGFLVLNIRQDQYNSKTDNAEKMICDYFEPNKSDEPDADSQVTATIKYAGKPEVRVGGSWKSSLRCSQALRVKRLRKLQSGVLFALMSSRALLKHRLLRMMFSKFVF